MGREEGRCRGGGTSTNEDKATRQAGCWIKTNKAQEYGGNKGGGACLWLVVCAFRMGGTTLFSRKERRRTTLGLGIFEIHLYLGFALKIFCHLLFNMTNFK